MIPLGMDTAKDFLPPGAYDRLKESQRKIFDFYFEQYKEPHPPPKWRWKKYRNWEMQREALVFRMIWVLCDGLQKTQA